MNRLSCDDLADPVAMTPVSSRMGWAPPDTIAFCRYLYMYWSQLTMRTFRRNKSAYKLCQSRWVCPLSRLVTGSDRWRSQLKFSKNRYIVVLHAIYMWKNHYGRYIWTFLCDKWSRDVRCDSCARIMLQFQAKGLGCTERRIKPSDGVIQPMRA